MGDAANRPAFVGMVKVGEVEYRGAVWRNTKGEDIWLTLELENKSNGKKIRMNLRENLFVPGDQAGCSNKQKEDFI